MKKLLSLIITNGILIILGIIILVLPEYIKYINKDQFFFDFVSLLNDHPKFRYPFGSMLLIIGLLVLIYNIVSIILDRKVFVIQKGLNEDFGTIDLNFGIKLFDIEPVVYTNICATKNKNKELLKIEKRNIYNFYDKNVEKRNICFLSVSIFPFIVYAGYCIGESGRKVTYYHYNRNKKRALKMRWGLSSHIKFDDECEMIKGSEVRTICISVSYNIDREIVKEEFQGTTIYFYKTNLIGTEVLKNKKDIDYIANEVRSIVAEKAKKTNLLLSCPAELCFAIGQKLKSPGLPEVSIYNYNAKQDDKWNWSITLDNKFE